MNRRNQFELELLEQRVLLSATQPLIDPASAAGQTEVADRRMESAYENVSQQFVADQTDISNGFGTNPETIFGDTPIAELPSIDGPSKSESEQRADQADMGVESDSESLLNVGSATKNPDSVPNVREDGSTTTLQQLTQTLRVPNAPPPNESVILEPVALADPHRSVTQSDAGPGFDDSALLERADGRVTTIAGSLESLTAADSLSHLPSAGSEGEAATGDTTLNRASEPSQNPEKSDGKTPSPNIIWIPSENKDSITNQPELTAPLYAQPGNHSYTSSNVPVNILDLVTVTSTLVVPDSFVLTDVNLQFSITHTYDSDLTVALIAPDGLRVQLFTGVGGSGDNFTNTVLDDESPSPVLFASAPFTGSFSPTGLLKGFDGRNAAGTWRLEITDGSSGDQGVLTAWSLTFTEAPASRLSLQPLGISSGARQVTVNDQITTFGGENVYALDLTAGQRISASVQTPELGGRRYSNDTDVSIPDAQTPVTSSITVGSSLTISDVDVKVLIDHRFDADLDIYLISPNGTRIELSTDNGGSGYAYYYTTFDDEALSSIASPGVIPPLGGHFRPEAALSAVDGTDAAGTWRLEVTDDATGITGTLFYWELIFNGGLNSTVRLFGASGEVAFNYDAVPGINDAAIVNAVVPTTGTYFIQVGSQNANVGSFTLEAGIYDASVTGESGVTTNLDPVRNASGNVAILGLGDGIGQSDIYTATLNAGESILVAATTPGGFYDPRLQVAGPAGFSTADDDSGPSYDSVARFTALATGTYTITVDYPAAQNFLDAVSQGSYALTLAVVDNATNDNLTGARPIAVFDYRDPVATTSSLYGFPGFQGLWRGEINATSDQDVFALGQLFEGTVLRITAQREGSSQLFAKTLLVNSASQIILSAGTSRSGSLGSSSFEIVVPATDTYYVVVLPDTTELGGSTTSTGAYQLFYSGFGVHEDAYENNDSKAIVDARPAGGLNSPNLGLAPPVTLLQNLAMISDSEDWFRFQTTAAGNRGDYVRIEFTHTRGDLDLQLLDAAGNMVAISQGTTNEETINLHGLPAGVYYARIYGYNGARNPQYSLRVQTQSPDQRLLSEPYTTAAQYVLNYSVLGTPASTTQPLQTGKNQLMVSYPSGGPNPFQVIFEVTRVGSMADQTTTQYDQLGHVSRQTDALGRDTTYQYDGLSRLVFVNGFGDSDASLYTYDGNDNRTSMLDSTGLTTYVYDALNRVTQINLPNGQGSVRYSYDLAGRTTAITYPNNTVVNYAYDAAGRLQSVTQGSDVTSYTYNPDGLLNTTTLPNGIVATNTYDNHGRLTSLVYTKAGAIVTGFFYTLDNNGNRTIVEIRRANTGTPDPNDFFSNVYNYQYDALNRLTRAQYPDGQVVIYTYDTVGNRLSTSTDPDGNGPQPVVVENYHYGIDNRLDSITGNGNVVLKQFFYDPRGNVVMIVTPTETMRLEYDYRNLLTSVEDGTNRIEYLYDGNGDRIARIVNGVRTTYVNDPNQNYTQALLELGASGTIQASYIYGLNRIAGTLPGQTDPLYFIADALGSTSDLADASGTVLQSYSYDAFGSLRLTDRGGVDSPIPNDFLFTGERLDRGFGLVYLRARYYDPGVGRFVSKDPLAFSNGPNNYTYVSNNPIIETDPSGLYFDDFFDRLDENRRIANHEYGDWPQRFVSTWATTILPATSSYRDRLIEERRDQGILPLGTNDNFWLFSERHVTPLWEAIDNWLVPSAYGFDRGGVLLNRAVDFVGDLSSITGATVDPVTGQVVLLGTRNASVPDLRLDDFVTAVHAVFGSAEAPGVTLDPQPGHESDPSYAQLAHLFGGLDDTDMGWVLLEADRVMKTLAAEKDNVSGASVTSSVAGYKSMLQRWLDRGPTSGHSSSRFWFVPTDVKLVRSPSGDSFVFDRTAVQLLTEDLLVGNGAVDPDAQAFATWFTTNYSAIAQEQYTTYEYPSDHIGGEVPSQTRIFARLEQVAKAIAFARFLYDNNIPIDFSWMENYQIPARNTPLEARTVQNSRTRGISGGTFTVTITGGVTINKPNVYLPDGGSASGLGDIVLSSRPDDLTQQWTANVGGQNQTAVALSLNSTHIDGLDVRNDPDLSYESPGDMALEFVRHYRSSDPTPGPFGFGWQFIPYDMEFSRPEFFSSSRSPYTFLNGLREGEIRITDQASGRVLTFVSSFVTGRDSANNFLYGGVNETGVPSFTMGGSEQPDGSTLTQNQTTHNYTLSRPDGSQTVFDNHGKLLRVVDNRNRAINYVYTDVRVTSIRDSAGQTILLSYNAQNRISQATGLGGELVAYTYDGSGDLVSADRVRQGEHMVYTYTYDSDHHITSVTLPDRVVDSTSISDLLGRTSTQGDARGNQFHSTFDPVKRTTVTTDMTNGTSVTRQTDSLNRPIAVTDQFGRTTHYFYSGTNRQPSVIESPDATRPIIFYAHDPKGNVTQVSDALRGGDANHDGVDDNPMLFTYDGSNNLVETKDARGFITKYTYNSFNQRTSMTQAFGTPLAATWAYTYDVTTGYRTSQADPTGVVTQYQFDSLGNVTRETVAPGTAAQTVKNYTYDAFSRRISEQDGAGRVKTYTYNGHNQVTVTTLQGTPAINTSSTYDPASGRKLIDVDYKGNSTNYTYNSTTGDLIQTTESGAVTRYTYDRFGNISSIRDGVGNVTTFEYDDLQRLVRTTSLGSTPRVTSAEGASTEIVIGFSETINAALVDNGTDVVVRNSQNQTITGAISFSVDGKTLTWTPTSANLVPGVYTITLLASSAGQFTSQTGMLLDGEFTGLLPSGNNTPGGDFIFNWTVDDHGNDSRHATLIVIPATTPGALDFAGDVDWFKFDGVAGNRFKFEVILGSLLDSVLTLYGTDGKSILQTNDDIDVHTAQFGSRIEWQAPQTGIYYLRVSGFHNLTGTYQLISTLLVDDHSDTATGATAASVPSVKSGRLEVPADVDFFSFNAISGQQYRVAVILGTLPDSILRLFSTDGTTMLAQNDDYAGSKASRLYWTATGTGTYFVAVSSYNGATAGTYELAISIDDHGDDSAHATAVVVGSQTAGNLEVKGDQDWFSFQATAGTNYRLRTTLGTLADSFLILYNSNGTTVLAFNDDYEGLASRIYWTAPSTGSYYLRVSDFNGAGTYTLAVSQLVDDAGNNAAAAKPVAIPSTTAGELEKPGDIDWFSFNIAQTGRYRFEVQLNGLTDSFLEFFGTDGLTSLSSNNDFHGLGSRIDWTADTTGTYYVAVSASGGSFVGAYSLNITLLESVPPTGSLAFPNNGSVFRDQTGYLEISWADSGSGIDTSTIDKSDVQVPGLTMNSVQNRGGGVWRYFFVGQLPAGVVTVSLPANRIADLHGNWNLDITQGFTYAPPLVAPLVGDFSGLNFNGSRPADPTAAVGPSNLIGIVNSEIGLFSKTGTNLEYAALDTPIGNKSSFFGAVKAGYAVFDPWAIYDRYSERYVVIAEELEAGTGNSEVTGDSELDGLGGIGASHANILIGISTSNSPNDLDVAPGDVDNDWHVYSIPATHDFGNGLAFIDYPKIAADADSLYITGNYFRFGDQEFQGVLVTRLEKTAMLNGTLGTRVDVVAPNAGTLQPAQSVGRSGSAPQLFVDRLTTGIRVWEMNDANVLSAVGTVSAPNSDYDGGAPQQGTTDTLDTLSSRLMNAVWRNDSLWTTNTVNVDGEATVRWYQIGTANGNYTLIQKGDIDPGPGIHTFMPAIAVDALGNMGITYTQSSADQFATMMFSGRKASDPVGVTKPGIVIKASLAGYDPSNATEERWGDYAGIGVDPISDATFWAFHEYAISSTTWGTWWGSFVIGSSGPFVAAHAGSGAPGSLNAVDFIFTHPMDTASFSVADDVVAFTGPGGIDLKSQITGFSWTDNHTLRVSFNSQLTNGNYSIVIGPRIVALGSGEAMDQDLDGTAGEALTDAYSATFGIPPSVARMLVSGSTWSSVFLDYLASSSLGSGGYAVPVGTSSQLNAIPWTNIDQIKIVFGENVTVRQSDLTVRGVNTLSYSSSGFSYDPATFTAIWSFSSSFGRDKLLISLSDAVTDSSGYSLDGNWTNSVSNYPSGNGTVGGRFEFRLNVLPGDANQSGSVNIFDTIQVRNRQFTSIGNPNYSPFYDRNGDGTINIFDTIQVRNRQFTSLPQPEP